MTTHHYVRSPLFGGALECLLPDTFADVSKLRQVPDNQEVFIDKDGFTSIIFDITERVGGAGSSDEIDGRALTTHLEELVGSDADTVKVWNSTETEFSKLDSSKSFPAYTLIATQTPRPDPAKVAVVVEEGRGHGHGHVPDFTAIILTLLRLEKESTDVLITINVPHIKGAYDEADVDLQLGRQGKLIGDAVEYAAEIWQSFRVKDWGLFNEI